MTGERAWRFYTIPDFSAPPENETMRMARETWPGAQAGISGGGSAWNAFSYDPELDLVYIGVGNGFPYNQAVRDPQGGDNLFLASIVAVRADTGEYVWHYQASPGEQWDHVNVMDMTLATLRINGRERRVLMQAPKNGFFYVIDRETGEFISAEAYADNVTWAERIDQETGRPVENPAARYHGRPGMFELWPAFRGAHSWLPQSYSPRTRLVYIPVIESATLVGDEGIDLNNPAVRSTMAANMDPNPELPQGRHSFLKAWDPVSQRERWRVELPGDWPGGTMATGGDLVFQGRIDGRFIAYNARNGRELWTFETQAPVIAPPISYSVDGRQYVTVITGNGATGGGIMADGLQGYRTDYRLPRRVLTFALEGQDSLPAFEPPPPLARLEDPSFHSNPAVEQQGAMVYAMNACMVCHGTNAIAGGAAPDLRGSSYILDGAAFRSVVRDGALLQAGMPNFPTMTPAQAETLRQYLRARSQQLPPAQ
jgi:quinohemoprotein ethanol dehydrogenase